MGDTRIRGQGHGIPNVLRGTVVRNGLSCDPLEVALRIALEWSGLRIWWYTMQVRRARALNPGVVEQSTARRRDVAIVHSAGDETSKAGYVYDATAICSTPGQVVNTPKSMQELCNRESATRENDADATR